MDEFLRHVSENVVLRVVVPVAAGAIITIVALW